MMLCLIIYDIYASVIVWSRFYVEVVLDWFSDFLFALWIIKRPLPSFLSPYVFDSAQFCDSNVVNDEEI